MVGHLGQMAKDFLFSTMKKNQQHGPFSEMETGRQLRPTARFVKKAVR
jgi:hypothetical protein